jgi:hypothetical protein
VTAHACKVPAMYKKHPCFRAKANKKRDMEISPYLLIAIGMANATQ